MKHIVAIAAACMASAPAHSEMLFCAFSNKMNCQGGECTRAKADETMTRLDADRNKYSRCDMGAKPKCEDYDVVQSGDYKRFRNFEMPGRAAFLKLSPTHDAVEVVSLAHMVLISHGHCYTEAELAKKSAP